MVLVTRCPSYHTNIYLALYKMVVYTNGALYIEEETKHSLVSLVGVFQAVSTPLYMSLFLLAGVLLAVPAPLDCRRQAFPFQNIPLFRQVCAVP